MRHYRYKKSGKGHHFSAVGFNHFRNIDKLKYENNTGIEKGGGAHRLSTFVSN